MNNANATILSACIGALGTIVGQITHLRPFPSYRCRTLSRARYAGDERTIP